MARGRVYSVSFSNVAVTAVQDLISVLCTSGIAIELHGFEIGQITKVSAELLRVSVKRLPATVTIGSVGSAQTPVPVMPLDAAATATGRKNDTVQATSSGTAVTLHADVFNILNGLSFFWPPEDRPVISISQAAVLSLDTAPAASMTMNCTLYFAELM